MPLCESSRSLSRKYGVGGLPHLLLSSPRVRSAGAASPSTERRKQGMGKMFSCFVVSRLYRDDELPRKCRSPFESLATSAVALVRSAILRPFMARPCGKTHGSAPQQDATDHRADRRVPRISTYALARFEEWRPGRSCVIAEPARVSPPASAALFRRQTVPYYKEIPALPLCGQG